MEVNNSFENSNQPSKNTSVFSHIKKEASKFGVDAKKKMELKKKLAEEKKAYGAIILQAHKPKISKQK